jgi:squalene-hopene/tetraprenyl-beta-curcumene cyclase
VQSTAFALYGFARCVRQYRESDGPFVTKAVEFLVKNRAYDGSFAASQDTQQKVKSTLAAAIALDALDKRKYADAVRAAIDFAAKQSSKPAPEITPSFNLEDFAAQLDPEFFPRTASMPPETAELTVAGLDATKAADVRTAASRLVLINILTARTPAPKPQELPANPLPVYDANATVDVAVLLQKGVKFLASRQSADGSYGSPMTRDQMVGVTALAAKALWAHPSPLPPEIEKCARAATEKVASAARSDGSIHGGGLENYSTAIAIGALVASGDSKYNDLVAKARHYITILQADEPEGYTSEHWAYGGFGYGNEERPDMSNTNFALDALVAAGAKSTDPALHKALQFLQRCQNRSESNTTEIVRDGVTARAGNDGGGVYYPGKSQAGSTKSSDGKTETPRSYGSMTYALIKGFVFAGLQKDDPRVAAAIDWCKKNYTLDYVPGYEEMAKVSPRAPYQGLYYYYLTMASSLSVLGVDTIETPDGRKHDWRREMAARLASMQKADGSWLNDNSPRWWEGDEVIATSYAVLTLKALQTGREGKK